MAIELTDKTLLAMQAKMKRGEAPQRPFDTACDELFATVSATNISFTIKFWNTFKEPKPGQSSLFLGKLDVAKGQDTEHYRIEALKLVRRAQKEDIIASVRPVAAQAAAGEKTFDQVADEFMVWRKTPIKKKHGFVPRKEAHRNDTINMKHASRAFGRTPITQVTGAMISKLLSRIHNVEGKHSTAEMVRVLLNQVFKFAGHPNQGYITVSPCSFITRLSDYIPCQRNLDADEIKKLWWGLTNDAEVLKWHGPRARLGIKAVLATMLRPGEIVSARRESIDKLMLEQTDGAALALNAGVVKNRKANVQPLNSLAIEVVDEIMALTGAKTGPLFPVGKKGAAFHTRDMSNALFGIYKDGRLVRPGICKLLGFDKENEVGKNVAWSPFVTHDCRRTGATLLKRGNKRLGIEPVPMAKWDACLGHSEKGGSRSAPVYGVEDALLDAYPKQETLDILDTLLRDAIGKPPRTNIVPLKRVA